MVLYGVPLQPVPEPEHFSIHKGLTTTPLESVPGGELYYGNRTPLVNAVSLQQDL